MTSIPVTFGSPSGEPEPAEIIVEGGTFGESHSKNNGKNEVTLGADGGRGKVTVKGGTFHCLTFSISDNTAPEANGYIDFLRIEGGAARLRQAYNYSTATARVVVAGGTYYSAHQWYGTMFQKGPFLFEGVNGATITINRENTVKDLVANDASLRFIGASPVTIMANGGAYTTCVLGTNVWFDNAGKVKLSGNEQSALRGAHFGPGVTEIQFDNSQKVSASANSTTVIPCDLTFTNNAYLYGSGTLAFDTTSGDHVFSGPIHGTELAMRKLGANTLTVSSTTNIPHLKIEEGTLLLKSTIAAKTLSVAAGATFTIDGATVTVTDSLKIENGATVNAINGGKIVRLSDVATTTDLRGEMIRSWDFIKTGAGDLRLYDPQLSGFVRAAEGTLKFSKQGLSDRYIKLTFKELLQFWYGGSYSPLDGLRTIVAFYDTSAARCLDSSSYNTRFVLGTHPSALTKGEVTAPLDTVWGGPAGYHDPFFMFRSSGGHAAKWLTGAMTNAEDTVNFQIIYYRLPDIIPAALDGINLCSSWGYGNAKKWTLETSATGEDGTWHEVLAVDERTPGMSQNNHSWLNGDYTKPAYLLSYDEPGVTGLAETLAVEADAGATIDFSMKTGGQTVNRIVYDAALGGGTLKNIVFAATGTLEIVNLDGVLDDSALLTLVDADGAANLANWTVTKNGTPKPEWKASARNGGLFVNRSGLIVIVR